MRSSGIASREPQAKNMKFDTIVFHIIFHGHVNFPSAHLALLTESATTITRCFNKMRGGEVCACMWCCHPIFSRRQSTPFDSFGHMSRGHTEGMTTQELNIPCYFYFFVVLHLPYAAVPNNILIARRGQRSLPLVDREIEFCVPTAYRQSPRKLSNKIYPSMGGGYS